MKWSNFHALELVVIVEDGVLLVEVRADLSVPVPLACGDAGAAVLSRVRGICCMMKHESTPRTSSHATYAVTKEIAGTQLSKPSLL